MTGADRTAYNFAALRVVPDVATGAFANVGIILHARTAGYLDVRLVRDPELLRARFPGLDVGMLCRYLAAYERICRGDPAAGPVALLPPSERFHWLTAPRSDVLQSSPVHEGVSDDPALALEELFARHVRL
ncbi:MAG TPA: DUF3037 domain-containing protein [Longimicrobiaceae bacterium]|nr:DUF3037 domain-containing protein [Longimicrobiaceae bacterium]